MPLYREISETAGNLKAKSDLPAKEAVEKNMAILRSERWLHSSHCHNPRLTSIEVAVADKTLTNTVVTQEEGHLQVRAQRYTTILGQ